VEVFEVDELNRRVELACNSGVANGGMVDAVPHDGRYRVWYDGVWQASATSKEAGMLMLGILMAGGELV